MLKCQKRRAGAIDQSMNQVNLFTGEGSNASSEVLGKTRVMEKEREVNWRHFCVDHNPGPESDGTDV